jgi:hypothetical protein
MTENIQSAKEELLMASQKYRKWTCAAAALLAVAAVPVVFAQRGQPIDGATIVGAPPDPSQLLDPVRKDEEAGYRLAPPAGSRLIYRTGVDLLSFVVNAKSWGGTLSKIVVQKDMSLDDFVNDSMTGLQKQFRAVQILENKTLKFDGYPARQVSLSLEEAGSPARGGRGAPAAPVAAYRQELVVQLDNKNEFMVLMFYSLLRDKNAATETFNAMLGSYELIDPVKMRERRSAGAAIAKKWLAGLSAENFRNKMNRQVRLFRLLVDGTDTGFISFEELEASLDGYKGIEVVAHSKTFPDGTVVKGDNQAFWAYSRNDKGELLPAYSLWDNISKRLANVPNPKTRTLEPREFWLRESGTLSVTAGSQLTDDDLRQLEEARRRKIAADPTHVPPPLPSNKKRTHIEINLSGDPSQRMNHQGMSEDPPPEAPAILPKFMEYTWTRMVQLDKPSEMSFWSFNSSSRKLVLRTLTVTGKKDRIQVNRKSVECWKCIDEMDPGSTTLWVDQDGQIVKLQTSDGSTMIPTTEEEMQVRWGPRLAGKILGD